MSVNNILNSLHLHSETNISEVEQRSPVTKEAGWLALISVEQLQPTEVEK